MKNEHDAEAPPLLKIGYETIRDLALFQEQYDRLTEEIQQAKIQLENSLPLESSSPSAQKRTEWRSWLQLQITSKQHLREELTKALQEKGFLIDNLPE